MSDFFLKFKIIVKMKSKSEKILPQNPLKLKEIFTWQDIIETFSIVVWTSSCNAKCPFCVAKLTPNLWDNTKQYINERKFAIASTLAEIKCVDTVALTWRWEPLLYPDQITDYLNLLQEYKFPFITLQTNGILLEKQSEKYDKYLKKRLNLWLSWIAISIVSENEEENRNNYLPKEDSYIDLQNLIKKLKEIWFDVRLTCVLLKDIVDNPGRVENLVSFSKINDVDQLTLRPVNSSKNPEDEEIAENVKKLSLTPKQKEIIMDYLYEEWDLVWEKWYWAKTFDLNWQNVSLTNSMTPNTTNKRQIIFQADGKIYYDWQFPWWSTLM